MTNPDTTRRTGGRVRGMRLNTSLGGLLIPIAIIGGISALELGRTADKETAQREVFFNIEYPIIMYFIFALSVAIILAAFLQRWRIWHLGKPQGVFDNFGARLTNAFTMGAGTSRVKNDHYAGIMHGLIYSSFLVLTLVS